MSEPVAGTVTNDATPRIVITYQDVPGPGETAASGVDLNTLRVELDGVDRTALFTKLSNQATAELPESLALGEGPHQVQVTLKDVAGNTGTATSVFSVDLTPPPLAVVEPPEGALLASGTPVVRVSYAGATAPDLGTLVVKVNGVDRTALFTVGESEAVATLAGGAALLSGPHTIEARLRDAAGNEAVATSSFVVDLVAPLIVLAQPASGARLGSADVDVRVTYADNHALDLGSFSARLDGQAVTLSVAADAATGVLAGVSEGGHTLSVSIRDLAGHETVAAATFSVDATAPALAVAEPAAGALLRTSAPTLRVTYADDQGVDLATLRVRVDGVDRTASLAVGAGEASGTLAGLSDGAHQIEAQIADQTGNLATATSRFSVDTLAPTGALASPGSPTPSPSPASP